MILLPYVKIRLKTSFTSQQILERIRDVVDSSKPTWSWKWPKGFLRNSSKPFEGTVDGFNFKINRIINYQNSFLPMIIGKIEGGDVELTLRPSIFAIVFMVLWLAIVWGCFVDALYHNWIEREPAGLMYLFGILLWLVPFKVEVEFTKKKLKEILGVQ